MILAVIPAREGSKRLPLKNIKIIAGKPLIAWTLQCANEASCLDHVLVSTESLKIKEIAEAWGGKVPFLRPPELAGDEVSSESVLIHVLDEWSKLHPVPDILVLLQPTSPLRTPKDIEDSVALLLQEDADSVETVIEGEVDPRYTFHYENVPKEKKCKPSGSVFAMKVSAFLMNQKVRGPRHFALVRPPRESIDIDTLGDFEIAEKRLLENI